MEYCKYHPLKPATFLCNSCDINCCDVCVDVRPERRSLERCVNCGSELESLGATYNAEPFWRRLEQSFRYPLNIQTLILIVGVSALTAVLSFVPLTILWILVLTGAFIRYAFTCLEQTSMGILEAPDITEAYEGGVSLLFQLLFILASIVGMVIGVGKFLGSEFAMFVGVMSVIALPAIIINFATTGDMAAALSPLKTFGLIASIGLPYGLLLAFILIMSASVGVLQGFVGEEFSLANMILQSIIANYYMIVVFHIMGYMIFQYQGKLGFSARASSDKTGEKSELDVMLVKIDVAAKEGDFSSAVELFSKAVQKFPTDGELLSRCFEFLYACNEKEDMDAFAPRYISFLVSNRANDKLNMVYKKILHVVPNYRPEDPILRYALAKECHRVGDSRSVVKLVNGLHKQAPGFEYLAEAYELLVDALKDIPNLSGQVEPCVRLVEKLKAEKNPRPGPVSKANFEAQELQPSFSEVPKGDDTQENADEPVDQEPKELPPIEFK